MGIRRVTMDDIAGECGVSKKTIYQHFKDKDQVVLDVTKSFLDKEERDLDEISKKAKDPLDELVQISKWFRAMLNNMDNSLVFDMRKYHPKSWKFFQQHKEKCVLCSMVNNFEKGKELGLYRSDINVEILSRFRVASSELPFDDDAFPRNTFRISDLQLEIFELFVYGIVTDKGKNLFETYKKQELKKSI